jgi:hypothetical protein
MNLTSVRNKVMSKAGKQVLVTRRHSPTILFAVGTVGLVTTVVLASRATLKMSEVFDEADDLRESSRKAREKHPDKYTGEDAEKDSVLIKAQTAISIAKLYTPAVICGTFTVAAFTGSHVILSRRNAALSAAYFTVDQGFKNYRERVVGELGKAKDREFLFGTHEEVVEVETDDGTAIKTVKRFGDHKGLSNYARCFNRENKHYKYGNYYNFTFLQAQERYANERLNAQGYLSLNDVLKSLGFEPTKAGQIVGWTKSGKGDNFVSFGIVENDPEGLFANGDTDDIWLDFNVEGNILDAYSEG